MQILVCSCDSNQDTFYPFYRCIEKYWPNHPDVIYSTETKSNPYFKTISKNYPLHQWSKRIRETLEGLEDRVLVLVDDVFIRCPVDVVRVEEAEQIEGYALLNFEKAFDSTIDIGHGWGERYPNSSFMVSIMCGLWDRDKLIDILSIDSDPWKVEEIQNTKGYRYATNTGDYIIDWGYRDFHYFGIHNGRWCKEIIPFFESEGIEVDLSRGVW